MPLAIELNAVDDLLDVVQQRVAGALDDRLLAVTLPPDLPLLVGRFDLAASARVIVNLIENAHKYAPRDTVIEWTIVEQHDPAGAPWLRFTIADRGPGVPPAERERIFEPFYRAPGAPLDVHGVGLGLAIARQLAEAQGGTLTYAPHPDGGSRFTLALPGAALADESPED